MPQINYTPPTFRGDAFNCPYCGAYSKQDWSWDKNGVRDAYDRFTGSNESFYFAECARCREYSVWHHKKMIYPFKTGVEPINPDAPEDVKKDYEEASLVLNLSPKSSNALLRLALQKLCIHLGAKNDRLDAMIGQLVAKKGLSPKIQKAMDAIRIYGNDSVHIGEIQDSDTKETAIKMFRAINIIIDDMITEDRMLDELMDGVGDKQKEHIAKRRQKTPC